MTTTLVAVSRSPRFFGVSPLPRQREVLHHEGMSDEYGKRFQDLDVAVLTYGPVQRAWLRRTNAVLAKHRQDCIKSRDELEIAVKAMGEHSRSQTLVATSGWKVAVTSLLTILVLVVTSAPLGVWRIEDLRWLETIVWLVAIIPMVPTVRGFSPVGRVVECIVDDRRARRLRVP